MEMETIIFGEHIVTTKIAKIINGNKHVVYIVKFGGLGRHLHLGV